MAKRIMSAKKIKLCRLESGDFPLLKDAHLVLKYAHSSVSSFYEIYQQNRHGSTGSPTHKQQDLLRAMLVFACSGLDAVVKQLIKDTLPRVIELDSTGKNAQEEFRKFVERRLKKLNGAEREDQLLQIDTSFISHVLASPNPKEELFKSLQKFLTNDSLQSRDQLLKVAAHFAITTDEVLKDFDMTKIAFSTRNAVIHEMDVDLGAGSRQGQKKRRVRSVADMVKYTENILNVGVCFINAVTKKIYGTS